MKKIVSVLFCCLCVMRTVSVCAETPSLSVNAKSSLLMEASTGQILYEQNMHEPLPPASVTKIMTMLLIMEAIDSGAITFDDVVTASENAKRMGGSTIFLDTGEQMSVYDLMKGIAVASANDACVAMAEYLSGSEEEFVRRMNERAASLGMQDTCFKNCNGLDTEGHVTSAYDIALMSRELLTHPKIFEFTTIWVDSLRGGAFGLANTNKLIRFYEGANGLKTGSTDDALYCLSAAARRGDMQLIAVVLGAPTTKDRFDGARALLDYGFAAYTLARPSDTQTPVAAVRVEKGIQSEVPVRMEADFTILLEKAKQNSVQNRLELPDVLPAPVYDGDTVGKIIFSVDGEDVGEAPLIAVHDVRKKSFGGVMTELLARWCAA